MSRETLKDFLNSVGLATNSISYKHDNPGENLGINQGHDLDVDVESGKKLLDLDDENIGLLGDYLSYVVENSNNIFKIAPGNERAATSKRGDSLVIAEEQGAANVFVEQGTDNYVNFNTYSNSQKFNDAGVPLGDIIDKTGKDGDAHRLYNNVEGRPMEKSGLTLPTQEGDPEKVPQAVQSVLLQNNRFTNVTGKTAYAPKNIDNRDFDSGDNESGTMLSQNQFGVHDKENVKVSIDQLKSIGASLLYKASGFDSGNIPGNSESIESLEEKMSNQQIFSNKYTEDSYSEVEFENLRSKNAAGAPSNSQGYSTRQGRGDMLNNDPEADSNSSFGSTYNANMMFAGRNRRLHKLQASIACLTLKKVTEDFIKSITEYIKFDDLKNLAESDGQSVGRDQTYDGPGPYLMGTHNQIKTFELDIFKKIILTQTTFPYSECFSKGIEIFFGTDLEIEKVAKTDHISQSPGYWLSVASSVLKSYDQLSSAFANLENFESDSSEKLSLIVDIVKSNKLIQFANVAATVGDVFFKSNNGLTDLEASKGSNRPWDVDSLPTTPATRVGKSRDQDAENSLSLAWRQGSVPSMYILPRNVVRASVKMNTIFKGANPVRGMLTSGLVKNTYLDRAHDGSFNKIPRDVVKRLEDQLEGEYVPFYIQDLRTNEIISFHAFLTSLTDQITPNYDPVQGYGRMDPVQIYKNTTRSINVGFTLYATSKEDFNEMWYKINKFVTLLYPQWTQGTEISTVGLDRFIQPFSQVLGASPIVRLRVGDVIKSNYSKFNLARMFGIGDPGINPVTGNSKTIVEKIKKTASGGLTSALGIIQDILVEAFYLFAGTPFGTLPSTSGLPGFGGRLLNNAIGAGRNYLAKQFINGFVNPLGAGLILSQLRDPNSPNSISTNPSSLNSVESMTSWAANLFGTGIGDAFEVNGRSFGSRVLIKHNHIKGYYNEDDGQRYFIDRPIEGMIVGRVENATLTNPTSINKSKTFKSDQTYDFVKRRVSYKVMIIDPSASNDLFMKTIYVDHQQVLPNPNDLFLKSAGAILAIAQPRSFLDYLADYAQDAAQGLGIGSEAVDIITDLYAAEAEKFMFPENNPFTRAYESTMGRGLAGVVKGINFNWLENNIPWETDYNSRAPIGCEISFGFDVIHDLPPGLGHDGYNRAPLYNVGDIMKETAGDAMGDDDAAEFSYKSAGLGSITKTGK